MKKDENQNKINEQEISPISQDDNGSHNEEGTPISQEDDENESHSDNYDQENIEKNKAQEKKDEKEEKEKNKDINEIIPSQANNNCKNENKEQNQECAMNNSIDKINKINLPIFVETKDFSTKNNIDEIQKKEIEMKKKKEENNKNSIEELITFIMKMIYLENLLNDDKIQNIIRFISKETNNLDEKENNININNSIPRFTIMFFYFLPIYVPYPNNVILFSPNTKNNNIENNNNKNKNDNNQKESNYNSIIKDFSKYEFANIEIRKQMEDFTYTNLNFHNKNNHNISLFAIYDGHNGKLVSEHLYKNFDKILLSNLEKTNYQIRKSLIDSFQQINSNFEKNPEAKNTGSTATVILIDNNNLYCANVGDSQCYYISKEKIIKLTKVHNCNDLKEVERIKKKNGIIFQNRIFGCINLTRTIGDIEFKEYGVTCIPDISKEILSENNSKYIILGSDGVWDVIDENDIINIEKKYGNNCKDFCKKIIKTAIEKKSQDNISCIVIKF